MKIQIRLHFDWNSKHGTLTQGYDKVTQSQYNVGLYWDWKPESEKCLPMVDFQWASCEEAQMKATILPPPIDLNHFHTALYPLTEP